jgi:hypothetical protein
MLPSSFSRLPDLLEHAPRYPLRGQIEAHPDDAEQQRTTERSQWS